MHLLRSPCSLLLIFAVRSRRALEEISCNRKIIEFLTIMSRLKEVDKVSCIPWQSLYPPRLALTTMQVLSMIRSWICHPQYA